MMAGCNKCGVMLPAQRAVDLGTGRRGEPTDGDFHVCPICGYVLILAGGRWRLANVDELFHADPATRAMLARLQKAIHDAARCPPPRGAGGMVN